MTIESTTEGNARVVKLSGRMTEEMALQLEQASQDVLDAGLDHLVLNIAELQYVSSLGLRSFVRVAKAYHATGKVALLCGMKGMVKEIFDMAHMGSLFKTFDSVDAALASLG
jgi:anti-anti-sigma factor